ncbi:alpha/beta hydrolase fold-1, partial [Tanacetum coccineum]
TLPLCNVEAKLDHLFQFWKSYIKRPMFLVGPSLGAAVTIDFLSTIQRLLAGRKVSLLKSLPLRFYATNITFNDLPLSTRLEWTYITRLHCLLPWWEEATVDFMSSGGYNVSAQINQVMKKTLIMSGENDRIIDSKLAVLAHFSILPPLMSTLSSNIQRLHCELPNAIIRQISNCGHIPHVEKPEAVASVITNFMPHDKHLALPSIPEQQGKVLINR